ncbi:hypothetical protein MFIFM68171_05529 [Madurella fahalii]|uniref:Polyketide synthase n=1 Tax=Madurella fahalii TaxID=1157608 RepID=A0ABQ0GC69_9PEZI
MWPIAIIGMSFRMPQDAVDESSFWEMLQEGRNVSTGWPETRIPRDSFQDEGLYARGAHFLKEDPGLFDAPFFSVTAKEAAAMDPQQRLALEVAYHAFENAGIPVHRLRGSRTAVFGATMSDDYNRFMSKDVDTAPAQGVTGIQPAILPNRISWYFDLRGPSAHVDTACSSSMTALDMACQSIHGGDATAALVIGSNLLLSPEPSLFLAQGRFLSPDSKCYSFDARANGYARGEGVVALIVKPLNLALQDGDIVRAVIRGVGSNQDGRTPTLTQPSSDSQEALIRHVYAQAGLEFDDTRYFEAHGTGTAVGDPIEMTAIGSVFRTHRSPEEPLYVGSVKANIGHLEGASGCAGIIKCILALEMGVIPPNALFENMNPDIDADFYNVQVPTRPIPWPSSGLRRVSVNSFGYGGTNSHVILDDALHYLQSRGLRGYHHVNASPLFGTDSGHGPSATVAVNGATHSTADNDGDDGGTSAAAPRLLVWSAADAGAARRMVEAYGDYYHSHIAGYSSKLGQLAYTLAARRSVMPWRAFAVVDARDPPASCSPLVQAEPIRIPTDEVSIAFVFTGQGAQYAGMGLELLHYPVFKESISRSDGILASLGCGWSILDQLHCEDGSIHRPEFSQPLCTVIQIALVELLRTVGVVPAAVVGHSSGEIAAAYAVGALSHESACKAAYFRGLVAARLRAETSTPGAMMAVNVSETEARAYLERMCLQDTVYVACINSPTTVTLSGPLEAIDELRKRFDEQGIFAQKLKTGVAYHSPAMRAVAADYLALMGPLEAGHGRDRGRAIPMISSVTGHVAAPKLLATPQYWVDNLISPVRFADAVQLLASGKSEVMLPLGSGAITDLVEIGPHAALRRPVRDSVPKSLLYHAVLERKKSPLQTTLALLGTLFCRGHPVSVLAANQQTQGHLPFLVDCPPYPFDHSKRYWSESRLSKDYRLRRSSPGYMLGRRAHDWNAMRPRWRNWLSVEKMPWLAHHVVTNIRICPGTGMVVSAIEAARQMATESTSGNNSARVISGFLIRDAQFLAPVPVGKTAQNATETVLHLQRVEFATEKETSWHEITIFAHRDDRWTECFRAQVQVQYEEAETACEVDGGRENRIEAQRVYRLVERAMGKCGTELDTRAFYDFCEEHGIRYGESFRRLHSISWDRASTSVAHIDLRGEKRVGDSPVHPAVLDAAVHLVIAQVSKGLDDHIPTLVPQRLGSAWISAKVWSQQTPALRVASVLHPRRNGANLQSSFYALDNDGTPLCTAENLTMAEVSRPHDGGAGGGQLSMPLLYSIAWKPRLSSLSVESLRRLLDASALPVDESHMVKCHPKAENTMRLAARKALRDLAEADLDRAPAYIRRYAAALRYHYGAALPGEKQNVSDEELEFLLRECETDNPDFAVYPAIGRALPSILRGETDPLDIMFKNDEVGAESLYNYLAMQQFRDGRLKTLLDLATHEKPSLRILEVGAGTGSMTRCILAELQNFERETGQSRFASYTCTDISPAFFGAVNGQYPDLVSQGRLLLRTLDLERDPVEQGYELGAYDLVVAGLVLHATTNLTATLSRIRALLQPGGRLAFQEVVRTDSATANVTFGSLEGWWLGTEESRRYTPLLDDGRWDEQLRQTGFSGADLVLRDYQSDDCHICSVIVSMAIVSPPPQIGHAATAREQQPEVVFLTNLESPTQRALALSITEQHPVASMTTLDMIGREDWIPPTKAVVISILELDQPCLAALSKSDFRSLQKLAQGVQHLLWVSSSPARAEDADTTAEAYASIATGLLRSIMSEEPSKHFVSLVIESVGEASEVQLVREVIKSCFSSLDTFASPELEFIVRDGNLTIGRVVKETELEKERLARVVPRLRDESWAPGPPLALQVGTPGMLDTMRFIEDTQCYKELGPEEVEIEAVAWPISFRDVFVALGRLGMEGLGIECAGVVTRVGSGLDPAHSHYVRPGERVVMVAPGCLRSHPRAAAARVVRMPDSLSFEDAVAAINPGMTAYHSLINVARLQAGDKVLIHSGAGSTGQMAIGIARMLGAEVFTTVGFDDKKRLIMDKYGIPEDHIFYSRNTSFAKGIMRVTGGYGVDVVLNSLAGEGLRASWDCIAQFGRFVEIGKADIGANASLPMASFAKNSLFAAVDLHYISQTQDRLTRQLLMKVLELVTQNKVTGPTPLHIYPISDSEKAFRYMQGGRNTGRIVLTRSPEDIVPKFLTQRSTLQFDANASYIVVGGFGGIGRAILAWMAGRGAKNLIVASRSGPSSKAAQETVRELESRGVRIDMPRCDVASADELSAALQRCAATMPPIKGCINAAMVLQDSIFENMTHDQWSLTVETKVHSSWNLHRFLPKDMDFFILLSSLCGVYGAAGQANYAAGCTFQDALARSRTACGYKGSVALDLGWMRTIGIIAETERYRRNRQNAGNMAKIEDEDLFALLDHYCNPAASSGPPLVDKSQLLVGLVTQEHYHAANETPIQTLSRPAFSGFDSPHLWRSSSDAAAPKEGQQEAAAQFRQAATASDRAAIVVQALRVKLAQAMGVAAEEVDPRRSLSDYGTDSLMAVELRNWIRRDFGATVAVFEIMGGAAITSVGELVAAKFEGAL